MQSHYKHRWLSLDLCIVTFNTNFATSTPQKPSNNNTNTMLEIILFILIGLTIIGCIVGLIWCFVAAFRIVFGKEKYNGPFPWS